ncbi:FU domain containing protein [Anopheles sinensis]|uniref:FU domain containing protein n=1 Tax=Anopheles sinensis TaxID=74873 RepID=A0A084W766_ANOSI|nr:FU domain containing protein [Anopheles sinensis]
MDAIRESSMIPGMSFRGFRMCFSFTSTRHIHSEDCTSQRGASSQRFITQWQFNCQPNPGDSRTNHCVSPSSGEIFRFSKALRDA